MKRYLSILAILLAIGVTIVGCGASTTPADPPEAPAEEPAEEPAEDPPAEEAPTSHAPGEIAGESEPEGPDSREGTISIEGGEEPTAFARHHFPGMKMVAYVPENIEVEEVLAADADRVQFHTAFGGTFRDDVYLAIELSAPGRIPGEILERERERLEADGYRVSAVDPAERSHEWAEEELALEKGSGGDLYVGRLASGNVGHRALLVMTHMPIEFAEGAEPRFRAILDEMQWYSLTE